MYKLWFIISILFFFVLACDEKENIETIDEDNKETQRVINENIVSVEAMVVKENIIEQKFPLTGVLVPQNMVDIVVEVSGKITNIKKELGDYVYKNKTLAVIDDIIPKSQYKQAEAHIISTENNLKILESNLASDKMLFENGDISELAYNNSKLAVKNAEAQYLSSVASLSVAKKTYDDTRIKSPISGFVSRKNINYGTMVNPGTVAYRVVDLSKLKIAVSVPQEIVNKIKVGGAATVTISALNGKSFDGIVKRVSPQADETTGGFLTEVIVSNKEKLIKAGMTAKLDLILTKDEKVLSIPAYSLVTKNDENYVYSINDNIAELVKVKILETMNDEVVISTGIEQGDTIVIVGMKNLGLQTKVNIEVLH